MISSLLLDCDGVIWLGDTLIHPHIKKVLLRLYESGISLYFVTNNSLYCRRTLKLKFDSLGLDFVREDQLYSTSRAIALYAKEHLELDKKAFVIGSDVYHGQKSGISAELEDLGVSYVTSLNSNPITSLDEDLFTDTEDPDNIGAVLMGFDNQCCYRTIALANRYLGFQKNGGYGCQFVATNMDSLYRTPYGIYPGTGVMVQALVYASGRTPVVVGKPNQSFLDLIFKEYASFFYRTGIKREETAMVGDGLDTDILFGIGGGLKTILVLTGNSFLLIKGSTALEDLTNSAIIPDLVLDSLIDLDPIIHLEHL